MHQCAHGGTALLGVFADQFHGFYLGGSCADGGELMGNALNVQGGGAVFIVHRFNEFGGGPREVDTGNKNAKQRSPS